MSFFLHSSKSVEEKIEITAKLLTNSSLLSTHNVSLAADKTFLILLAQVSFFAPRIFSKLRP